MSATNTTPGAGKPSATNTGAPGAGKPPSPRASTDKRSSKGSRGSINSKGSKGSKPSKTASKTSSSLSTYSFQPVDDPDGDVPEFIYGGPFIVQRKCDSFLDTPTPYNNELSGTYKKSHAYRSLKDRMPVILTRIIDYLSRERATIKSGHAASEDDVQKLIHYVTKLKNDLVTNKDYEMLVDDPDRVESAENAEQWNAWIHNQTQPKYFFNTWLFTECYIYRRIQEGCELAKSLSKFDVFGEEKRKAFNDALEFMCIVGERVYFTMLGEREEEEDAEEGQKLDFILLMKLTLWANQCDLSMAENAPLGGTPGPNAKPKRLDPIQMVDDCKPNIIESEPAGGPPVTKRRPRRLGPIQMVYDNDRDEKILVDHSAKIYEAFKKKKANMQKKMDKKTMKGFKEDCTCTKLAKSFKVAMAKPLPKGPPPPPPPPPELDENGEPVEPPKPPSPIPCPSKLTTPACLMFAIVCDNAGYELFCDLCLATFLIKQKIFEKIRFHVKNQPWFVSDTTREDFMYMIQACKTATFSKVIEPEPVKEGEEPWEKVHISSECLQHLAALWEEWLDDGTFILCDEDYWTYPHPFKDMKERDYWQYRKLQFATATLYKGDLNYRKLMADRNTPPSSKLDPNLQKYNPSPMIAVRTIKSEVVCGLPGNAKMKKRLEWLRQQDPTWMEKGTYGLIQWGAKGESFKNADRPCPLYHDECRGAGCPHFYLFYGGPRTEFQDEHIEELRNPPPPPEEEQQ